MKKKHRIGIAILILIAVLTAGAAGYLQRYYHAGAAAKRAMKSGEEVTVIRTKGGWLFDGPGKKNAVVFYPGAKVEAASYAPLLRRIAKGGTDCFLADVPLRLAVFDRNAADRFRRTRSYQNWYLMGHSLGGVVAAGYTASHEREVKGLILLASYPTKPIRCPLLTIRGNRDGVLRMSAYQKAGKYRPQRTKEIVIPGGNHGEYGDYGHQKGDGTAGISSRKQQEITAEAVLAFTK